MREILTPEQRARLEKASAAGDTESLRQVSEELSAELTPEQRALLDEGVAEAQAEVRQQMQSENEYVVNKYTDLSSMLSTLQELPDAAGTEAFRAAYKRKQKTDATLMRHIKRVKVNMGSAWPQLCASHPSLKTAAETAAMAALLSTMEALPDGAGTEAFVAAHNVRLSSP